MGLEIIEVQSCCHFVSLRTGTKIFGFLSLLSCFFSIILAIVELVMVAKKVEVIVLLLILHFIVLTIQMITSVFLLLGAYQEKAKLIPPWLVSTVFAAVMEIVFTSSLVWKWNDLIGISVTSFTENMIFTLFSFADDIYGLLVVFSYYRLIAPQ